jgi:hypothetical protein
MALFDRQHRAAHERDMAAICCTRDVRCNTDALLTACDAMNRAGVADGDGLLGDLVLEVLVEESVLPAEFILTVRSTLLDFHPGLVAREPALVAFWDLGPDCAIVASHTGEGDQEVIGHVPWANSNVHANDGNCAIFNQGQSDLGRRQQRYWRETIVDGIPDFRADLDSNYATRPIKPKWLKP